MQSDARIVHHPFLLWIIIHKLQVTWVDLDDIDLLHTRKTTDEVIPTSNRQAYFKDLLWIWPKGRGH
jgi:hypothetical protein